jgi:hypothetical protein
MKSNGFATSYTKHDHPAIKQRWLGLSNVCDMSKLKKICTIYDNARHVKVKLKARMREISWPIYMHLIDGNHVLMPIFSRIDVFGCTDNTIRAAVSNLRCRSMAWHREANWLWHIVFTDANSTLFAKWARVGVFGYTFLEIRNIIKTLTGSNDEPNGPNSHLTNVR